jgi:putative hydrolase of the HAD superfamily
MDDVSEIIKRLCKPLEPIPTGVEPALQPLPPLRCVLFDVYGTLLVSGSGDVGTLKENARLTSMRQALEAAGVTDAEPAAALDAFLSAIEQEHRLLGSEGVNHPEVDIRAIWKTTLERMGIACSEERIARLALEYECRANPVWPMPGAKAVLETLRAEGVLLGIISNAQWYTPLLLSDLMGAPLPDLGFEPELCWYSFEHRIAKPSAYLYQLAERALQERGVAPAETLYVGNDMLNDVFAASQVGFRTALFAGDARSLRRRDQDPRCAGATPDVILTELTQLLQCVRP